MEGTSVGPYLVGAELGSGGMGKVYRAEVVGKASGLVAGQQVALKILHPHLLEKPGFFKRFLREAEIGKSVRHPNVVCCFDCDAFLHEGRQLNYLVMEYVEGQTLRSLLAELVRVPEELCRHLGREVASGLAAIHEAGVVHGDLKPENVLITPDHAVKVMDLGVARLMEETLSTTQAGGFIGTIEYAAPEQFRTGEIEIDGRADLCALGVMLYELSTARHPYRDSDVHKVLKRILEETPRKAGEVNPQLSPFFEEVVARLMAKDREDRFASAKDVLKILVDGEKSDWWNARAQAIRLETKRPLRRIRIPRETAVYGREDELARLQKIYELAQSGQGQVLLIEGEAGIGKSRLVDEFVGRLHAAGEDVNFLFGSYPPGGAATASGAWSTAYREHFGSEGLEERLVDYLTITQPLIPAFAALLRGEPSPEGKQPLTKDSLQTAFVHATRALAAERPTIVLIEDLHFAPEEGRAMLASLALAVPEHRILLIGTSRPGLPEAWRANIERLDQASAMALPRLGPKDLTKLLVDAFRSESLAEELSYRIAAKSDGNPFFVFEIIRGLREGQFITQNPDGSWMTSKKIEHIRVPSSVLDLVKARVSGLSEEERDLLDIASCCGFEFDPLVVAEAAGMAQLPMLKRLAQVERQHRLVLASGAKYVFDHHQVQEALYGSLSEPLQQAYHAALGQALEARGSDDVVAICEHYLKGAQGQKALPHLEAALTHLEKNYANERAIELMDLALSTRGLLAGSDRGGILMRESKLFHILGRTEDAWSAIEASLVIAEETSDRLLEASATMDLGALQREAGKFDEAASSYARALKVAQESNLLAAVGNALYGAGEVAWTQNKITQAREYFDRSLALANEIGDQSLASNAHYGISMTLFNEGLYEESVRHARQSLEVDRALRNRSREISSMDGLANALLRQGRTAEACEWLERSLPLCIESGDRQLEKRVAGNLGVAYKILGRRQDAQRCYEHALDLARQIGDLIVQWRQEFNLGIVLRDQGCLLESGKRFKRTIALSRQHGNREGDGYGTMGLAVNATLQGNWAEAREHLDQALSLAEQIRDRFLAGYVNGYLYQLFRSCGEFEKALAQSELLLAEAGESDMHRAWSLLYRADILLDLGDLHGAREDIRSVQAVGYAPLDSSIVGSLVRLSELSNDCDEAERLYRELLQMARDDGNRIGIMESLLTLGELLSRNRSDEAIAILNEAAAIAHDVGLPQAAYAECIAALAKGEKVDGPRQALALSEEKLNVMQRMEARYRLWQAAGNPADLTEAKRVLQYVVDHSPAKYRESMVENVRLYREIAAAQ